ncbi:hypothetical protein CMI37_28775 [Candidatus Pacearchaeota archaeon]|nr:hypothetical protein [Candidatus Pacearchaeota archaeon]
MSDELTYSTYRDAIKSIAQDIMEEHPSPDEDSDGRREKVWEWVDGHHYVIYYAYHEEVLRATENEPDGAEVAGFAGEKSDWRDMRQVAVFLAMEADVHEELRRLEEEKEEAEELAEVEA